MIKNLLLLCLYILPLHMLAQTDKFCSDLETIIKDAGTGFKNTKDTVLNINAAGIAWGCKVKIKGVMKARIISAMGIRYEGALYQTKAIEDIQLVYDEYKKILRSCLAPKGYEVSSVDNFYPGMKAYKKIMYTQPMKDENAPIPPHVSMEVDYLKQNGTYTIVLYVWQH